MRVETVIAQTMDSWPHKVAVVYKGRQWTYGGLRDLVATVKNRLSDGGFTEGDRAILWMENSPDYIAAYLAVLQAGGVVVAIHPQVPVAEVARIIRHVGATGLIASSAVKHWTIDDMSSVGLRFIVKDDQVIACRHGESTIKSPADLAQIIYTSGSTGQPKGVMLTHRNLMANTKSIL